MMPLENTVPQCQPYLSASVDSFVTSVTLSHSGWQNGFFSLFCRKKNQKTVLFTLHYGDEPHTGGNKKMAGKFEIYKDKAGEFRFRLKAGNGQTILAGEGYKARAGCTNGIESVKKNASDDDRYERKTTESGKFRFNLK